MANPPFYNPDNPNYFGPYAGQGNDGGYEAPPVTDVGNLGGSGGGSFLDGLSRWLPPGLGGTSGNSNRAFLLPALAMAAQGYRNAGQYRESGCQAAETANPFGKYRGFYGDRLQALYNDPTQIENTPGYKFALQQGMDATARNNASKGYTGSGKMTTDLMEYAQGLASQTWDKERNALMNMAGAQFNPADAGRLQMEGDRNAMEAENGALGAMMFPFMGNDNDPTQGGGSRDGSRTSSNPGLVEAVLGGNRGAINQAIQAGMRYVKLPDGSTADLWAMARGGYRTGEDDGMFYPNRGLPDGAPGEGGPSIGYDPFDTGGYGGGGFGDYDENGIWSPGGGGDDIDWGNIDWGNFGDWFSGFGSDLGGLAQGGGL